MANNPPTLADLLVAYDNKEQFRRLREQLSTDIGVVPFVGAGLSIPCNMPGWEGFLIAEGRQCGVEDTVQKLLSRGGFEEAAEELAKALGARGLADRLETCFGQKRDDSSPIRGPVMYVSQLARGPVVTTNFDRILEQVYDGAGYRFEEVLWGPKPDLLARALYANSHFLIKLHGDVADRSDRILTLSEYEAHYGNTDVARVDLTRPLPKLLRQLFTSRTLLFLGCSLSGDRTLELLRRVAVEDGAPPPHFAIVECPPETGMLERKRFLADLNIRPIWFPAGEYRSVETYLKALVEGRPRVGALTQPAFGLALDEIRQEHRYLSDAGDFQVEVFYTVRNVSQYDVSTLLPDSMSFSVPDPQALQQTTTLDCQIVDDKSDLFSITPHQRSFEALQTQKLDGRDRPITRISWRPTINPPLPPKATVTYKCVVRTRGTERDAFSTKGSVAGMATFYGTPKMSLSCEAPAGYRFDRSENPVFFLRTESGQMVEVAGLPAPTFVNAQRLAWELDGSAVRMLVNYLVRIRFVPSEGAE